MPARPTITDGPVRTTSSTRAEPARAQDLSGRGQVCPDACQGHGLQSRELTLQSTPAAVMQAVNRAFRPSHPICDLARTEADDMAKKNDLALLIGERGQRRSDSL